MFGDRIRNQYLGISDRVLFRFNGKTRIGWTGFYDYDRPTIDFSLRQIANSLRRNILVFRTGQGFHFVSLSVTDWSAKVAWYQAFRNADPTGNYYLRRDNFCRLSRKYGKDLTYAYCEHGYREYASDIHFYAYSPVLGESVSTLRRFVYPRLLPIIKYTARCYSSDPHAVIEVANYAYESGLHKV